MMSVPLNVSEKTLHLGGILVHTFVAKQRDNILSYFAIDSVMYQIEVKILSILEGKKELF